MIDLPGKTYGAISAWPDPDAPGRWRYLPQSPGPQRGQTGHAHITAVEAGDVLMLSIGTVLAASEPELAAAKTAIARETGVAEAAIDLRPAEAEISGATLILAAQGAAPVELASARPSPVPPYPAAFSAMLQGDRAKQANAAIKLGEGRLSVRYAVRLLATRGVTARLKGHAEAGTDLKSALDSGSIELVVTADDGASDALKADARARVIDAASAQLARLAPNGGYDNAAANLDAVVTRTEPAPVPLDLEADVAGWMT